MCGCDGECDGGCDGKCDCGCDGGCDGGCDNGCDGGCGCFVQNGFWLALGWCIFFFMPSLILAVKLAKHFRTMHTLDSYGSTLSVSLCVCVWGGGVRVCVSACVHACACVRLRACVCTHN